MTGDERARLEESMALKAPLSYELEAVGKATVEAIQKAPPEARPALMEAAVLVLEGMQRAGDASIQALPSYGPSLSPESIKARSKTLQTFLKHLPPDAPASALLPAISLLDSVGEMVDPFSTDPPTIPHARAQDLLDRQVGLLIKYVQENALT